MNTQHIVILPGLSSPAVSKYTPCYDLLVDQAKHRGWIPEVVFHPGQVRMDGSVSGSLSPDRAVENALEVLMSLEEQECQYRVLGISFGCFVALASLAQLKNSPGLVKAALWGPIPYWYSWKSFGRGERDSRLGKGTTFAEPCSRYHETIRPIEYLLTEGAYPVYVCVASIDEYIPTAFITYLEAVCQEAGRANMTFSVIGNCSHNVSPDGHQNWRGYVDAVFA